MALSIQTNYASMVAQNSLAKTSQASASTFEKLSSGFRINSAADDAAGLGISKRMEASVRSYTVAARNAQDGISRAQTADGGAEQIHGLLTRMRELAVQGSNGTLTQEDSDNLQTEFASTQEEITRIANVTTFNGVSLLSGAQQTAGTGTNFQVGINNTADDRIEVLFGGADATELGVDTLDISSQAGSQGALDTIDTAIQSLSTIREGFGSSINRLQAASTNLDTAKTNLSSALSRVRDTDIASEAAQMARNNVLSQAGTSVLAQANQAPQAALSLLRG
jgi:flagellin